MFDKQPYDSPPVYTPPSNNGFGAPGSVHAPLSDYNAYPPPPGSYYIEDKPQHFYKWLSPPGIVKAMMAVVIVLCVAIFACVASTLMWDIQYANGMGIGYGYGSGYGGGYGGGSYGSGYGGYGSYGGYGNYQGSYISPYSAKTAMIAMAAINFIGALAFFIASFSKASAIRSRKYFLALLIASVIMAVLQVNNVEESRSVQDAPTLLVSEKGGGLLNASANSVISYPPDKVDGSSLNGDTYDNKEYSERTACQPSEAFSHGGRTSSSPSEETGGGRKPSANRTKRRRRNPDMDESQYETEYTTGGETGNELDMEEWESMYPEITSDEQRHDYKSEFDADLREYKRMCADMDDVNDQFNKLSRQLDTVDDTSAKYQGVAEEYNHLKDFKRTPEYQSKKKECRRLRHKLFHIKRMVKNYDKSHS
ncbi:occludin isoform X2 [Phyllopteryx taeniolatus]|uniref:occludin isoform X2 n=1 Tax=Phyllopteryx taeniolatus TaxID=161469 RepID=UPI002AD51E26|nr:occludin isoform X2 [Phyllopteryx taeniolatus]